MKKLRVISLALMAIGTLILLVSVISFFVNLSNAYSLVSQCDSETCTSSEQQIGKKLVDNQNRSKIAFWAGAITLGMGIIMFRKYEEKSALNKRHSKDKVVY